MAVVTTDDGKVQLRTHSAGSSTTESLTPEQARKVAVHLMAAAGRADRHQTGT